MREVDRPWQYLFPHCLNLYLLSRPHLDQHECWAYRRAKGFGPLGTSGVRVFSREEDEVRE